MASAFTWLDHSESDRRDMQQIIDLFRESDTRDELGIGQVRDIFANLLFPGTSTIQTRARYFLFVPWVFMEMERRKIPSRRAKSRGREFEVALINALETGGESSGVIGIQAKASLKRLASSVYWHGLGVLGIQLEHQSIEDYYRSLDSFYRMNRSMRTAEADELLERAPRNWHAELPKAPDDLFKSATMSLTRDEAGYLRDRMRITIPESMLAHIVDMDLETDERYPWEYPLVVDLPSHIREWLLHSQNFAEVIHGAALLYNLMLAELAQREDLINHYGYALEEWASKMVESQRRFDRWNRKRFWAIARTETATVRRPTQLFIDRWLDMALDHPTAIRTDPAARTLIEHRERTLKRSQARLTNLRALEKWNEAAGTGQLNYRWRIAQRITNDIVGALRDSSDA
jgi:hypothetical protein